MAKKNVRDDPSKTQVTENPQMSDIVLVLDKMEPVSYTHLDLPWWSCTLLYELVVA